jgi:hypothetical protein
MTTRAREILDLAISVLLGFAIGAALYVGYCKDFLD